MPSCCRYGVGLYFAVDPRLAAYFLTVDPETGRARRPDDDGNFTLILAAVVLGRVGAREALLGGSESQRHHMASDLRHPANRNPPVDCHSATGPMMKEIIVYDNAQAFPAFTVSFRLKAHGPPLPDPYIRDENTNHGYLRSLPQAQVGFVPRMLPTGVRSHVDSVVPQADHQAKLLFDWTAASGHGAIEEQTARLEVELELARGEVAELTRRLQAAEAGATGTAAEATHASLVRYAIPAGLLGFLVGLTFGKWQRLA